MSASFDLDRYGWPRPRHAVDRAGEYERRGHTVAPFGC
jgi:hypothetical protein